MIKIKFEGTNANKIKPTNLTQIIKILYKITKYEYWLAFFNLGVYHIYIRLQKSYKNT